MFEHSQGLKKKKSLIKKKINFSEKFRNQIFTILATGHTAKSTEPALDTCYHRRQQHWSAAWWPVSKGDALLPRQEPAAMSTSWPYGGCTAAESKEGRGRGFTHLTTGADQKLLWLHYPNSHLWRTSGRTVGRDRGRTTKDKKIMIIKKLWKDREVGWWSKQNHSWVVWVKLSLKLQQGFYAKHMKKKSQNRSANPNNKSHNFALLTFRR